MKMFWRLLQKKQKQSEPEVVVEDCKKLTDAEKEYLLAQRAMTPEQWKDYHPTRYQSAFILEQIKRMNRLNSGYLF